MQLYLLHNMGGGGLQGGNIFPASKIFVSTLPIGCFDEIRKFTPPQFRFLELIATHSVTSAPLHRLMQVFDVYFMLKCEMLTFILPEGPSC